MLATTTREAGVPFPPRACMIDRCHNTTVTRLIHVTRLKRNVQYCVAVSTDWPDVSLYYGSDCVLDSVECGGVTYNFDNESTLIAEFCLHYQTDPRYQTEKKCSVLCCSFN